MADLANSFQNADQAINRANISRDVNNRWASIRQAYFRFRDDVSANNYDGNGPRNGRGDYPGSSDQPQISIHQGRQR